MAKERSYHFSAGNSTFGPVGFCASVRATSAQEAVDVLRASLPEAISVKDDRSSGKNADRPAVEYLRVYLNPAAVTVEHIDDDV